MLTSRRGFTLLEISLVLALIAVLAAITLPSILDMYAEATLDAAADGVNAAWNEARSHAINESRPYRFAIVKNHGNYRIAPDSSEFWSGSETADTNDGTVLVKQEALPRGIRFTDADMAEDPLQDDGTSALKPEEISSDQWTSIVTFLPDGTAEEDVEIVFQSRSARPLSMKLRAVTGNVTIRPLHETPAR